jgi:hypothetical protein
VLVTHYPLRTAHGQVEPRVHRLRDHQAALACAAECGIGLWVHGHIHRGFHLPASGASVPFPLVCAGSATQDNRWSYLEYAIDGQRVEATVRTYHPDPGGFRDASFFQVDMPPG